MLAMNPEYRQKLLALIARLDQVQSDAEKILAEPIDAENGAMAKDLHLLIVEMRMNIKEKLEREAD
jgi:hypothetical protein